MGKWNSNSTSIFRFSFSHDIEKQIWILLFVFRFRLTLKNAFELRFSFFVFVSLWKTDMNFVFRFHITFKNGFEFRFSFSHHFNKRIWISAPVIWSPRTPPRGWPGNSLFMQRKATEFSPHWGQSEWWTPPPAWYAHTHGTPFLTSNDK